ncbi:MAG: hypothetical protein ETSY2_10160 [Candidatus Entotheonella gemina]|uniref:Uncharacterized protein n=1 Tax=Candidatus Entotheonella gemina TaxID=1429439 RepID=W4MDA7_9BACT|nr:MAG: hypothetical protein ETSY2_10160 [Candidatus Entotheonella gemina]
MMVTRLCCHVPAGEVMAISHSHFIARAVDGDADVDQLA